MANTIPVEKDALNRLVRRFAELTRQQIPQSQEKGGTNERQLQGAREGFSFPSGQTVGTGTSGNVTERYRV